ncbi:MAG: S41 family peptidase [bacterium]
MEAMHSPVLGYLRFPTFGTNQLYFVAEDNLWEVALEGGRAQRLTESRSELQTPRLSPCGRWLALVAAEEGEQEVYCLPAEGGPLRRLTYVGHVLHIDGWSADGTSIRFCGAHRSIHGNADAQLYEVSLEGGPIRSVNLGPARTLSIEPAGLGRVLGRNTVQNSRWKRYRGGCHGEIWVDASGEGTFERILSDHPGNPVAPIWWQGRIYFLSDVDRTGNLWSCQPDGSDLRQETKETGFYVRQPAFGESQVIYHRAGSLCRWESGQETGEVLPITLPSPQFHVQRKFVYGSEEWEDFALHPKGHSVALSVRGRLASMPLWELAVQQHGKRQGTRYRLPTYLADGRLATIADEQNSQEELLLFAEEASVSPLERIELPEGRVQSMVASPTQPALLLTTSRLELWYLNLEKGTLTLLDASDLREIEDVVFSPDGNWVAYSKHLNTEQSAIFLCSLDQSEPRQVTEPVRYDFGPAFDPEGQWLYFLSSRTYQPIWDTVQIGASFARSMKPYLIALRNDLRSPFLEQPAPPGEKEEEEPEEREEENSEKSTEKKEDKKKKEEPVPLRIDWEGLSQRIIEFPVNEGIYGQVFGLRKRVLFSEFPLSSGSEEEKPGKRKPEGLLWAYDFEKQEKELLLQGLDYLEVTPSARTMAYASEEGLRVLEAGANVSEDDGSPEEPSRKTGWLDLDRLRFAVELRPEWEQMFHEAWRLQREFFWDEEMSGVRWQEVAEQYRPLLDRVASRAELSDLIWEMQGELGTSHAYEYGGDYPPKRRYQLGRLGVDLEWDVAAKRYVIQRLYAGDPWRSKIRSPLCEPGLNVREGDYLCAIGGVPLDEQTSPGELLLHQAEQMVPLTLQHPEKDEKPRIITVRTLRSERAARYRDWVEGNRRFVAEQTAGRVGYLHIPDMSTQGLAEFHRGFLAQVHLAGLILDVRYNAGGMVSPLILEKLAHRHLGYDVRRWGAPESYPYHTLRGHLLALTNQFAGSDGDMFSYSFRELKMGPLLGKRTWGGVIGIDSRYQLVDGTTTTQPQYSIWFHKAGWNVENQGVTPDEEIEDAPHDYAAGRDAQLERSIQRMLQLLEEQPIEPVSFTARPRLG